MSEQLQFALQEEGSAGLYRTIVAALEQRVVGHEHAVRRLALAGVQHVLGHRTQRFVLVGPSGSGKSTLITALADALGVGSIVVDVASMSETNWHGFDLADAAQSLYLRAGSVEAMQRGIILLDEVDKIATRRMTGTGREYRVGKQESLLALLGGGMPIRFGPMPTDRSMQFTTDRCLIVAAGVFRGLPAGIVGPEALIRLGLMPELVERLGSVLRLEPLRRDALCRVLRAGLAPAIRTYADFGVILDVPESTLLYAASAGERTELRAGPRTVVSWLMDSAERRLVAALESGPPPGGAITLSPDDLRVPPVLRRPGRPRRQ